MDYYSGIIFEAVYLDTNIIDSTIAAGGRYDNIIENWSIVERNYELMQLTDTQLTTFSQLHIKDVLDKPIPKLNRFQLCKLIVEDKLWNAIPNYQNWVNDCFMKLDNQTII